MSETIFVAKGECGCVVAAYLGLPGEDNPKEIGEFMLERTAGQTVEVAPSDMRVGADKCAIHDLT